MKLRGENLKFKRQDNFAYGFMQYMLSGRKNSYNSNSAIPWDI